MNKEIKIGLGLGNITFGSNKNDVKTILGEPNEIEKLDVPIDDEEISLEQWHYDEIELSASFDDDQDGILDTLAVSSSDYTINGFSLIGKKMEEINDLLNQLQLGSFEKEDLSDDEITSHLYSFMDTNMNFWFEDEELSEIQWGPLFTEDDSVIYPN